MAKILRQRVQYTIGLGRVGRKIAVSRATIAGSG
jgi:hypothetical protein